MLYYLDTVPVPPNIQAYLQSRASPQLSYARPGDDQDVQSKDKRSSSATFSRDFKFKKDSSTERNRKKEPSHNKRGKSKSFCNFKSKIPLVVTSSVRYDCNGNLEYDTGDVMSRENYDVTHQYSSFDSDTSTSSEMSFNSSLNSSTNSTNKNCLNVHQNYNQPRRCHSALSYHQPPRPASRQLSAPTASHEFGMRREKSNIPVLKYRSKSLDKRRSKSTERPRSMGEQPRSHSPGIPIRIDGSRGRRGKRDIEPPNDDVFVRSSSPIVNHSYSSRLCRSVDDSFRTLPNYSRPPFDNANGYTSNHRHRRTTTSSSCGSSATSLSRSSDCEVVEVKVHHHCLLYTSPSPRDS